MSPRERWTVYPLLFLALGVAMRDKITSSIDVKEVVCEKLTLVNHEKKPLLIMDSKGGGQLICESLVVVSREGKPVLKLDADQHGAGQLLVFGPDGKTVLTRVGAEDSGYVLQRRTGAPPVPIHSFGGAGAIETYAFNGAPQVKLRSIDGAGAIETHTAQNMPQALLKTIATGGALIVFSPDATHRQFFSVPLETPPMLRPNQPRQPKQPQPAAQPGDPMPDAAPSKTPVQPLPSAQPDAPQPPGEAAPSPREEPQPAVPPAENKEE